MNQSDITPDLAAFIQASPTPFHATRSMRERLLAAGFEELNERDDWSLQSNRRYVVTRNDSSLIAFNTGEEGSLQHGLRLVGAHTDSPCLRVKPQPELSQQGIWQLGVEIYGGVLLAPWFDRDLSLAGRVTFRTADGALHSRLIDFQRPIAVIPSLAIHLNRSANEGQKINPQTDMPPLLAVAVEPQPDLRALLAQQLAAEHPDVSAARVLDFELSFYDTQPAAVIGLHGDFITSARLDNLLSCHAGLLALLESTSQPAMLVCTDHEEVGSSSHCGADGPFLEDVLMRLLPDPIERTRVIQRSLMISADNAHAVHPNFADRHDASHGPRLNGGPVIKINSNQRYATNSETAGFFRDLCEQCGVPVQSFVVRSDMGCGSTIGPITASRLGVRTVDIGVPTYAMHSIREMAGAEDPCHLVKVLQRFFDSAELI